MKLNLYVHLLSMLARLTNAKALISKMCARSEKACKKLLGRKNEAVGYWTCTHTHRHLIIAPGIILFTAVLMSTDFEKREEKQQVRFTESWL